MKTSAALTAAIVPTTVGIAWSPLLTVTMPPLRAGCAFQGLNTNGSKGRKREKRAVTKKHPLVCLQGLEDDQCDRSYEQVGNGPLDELERHRIDLETILGLRQPTDFLVSPPLRESSANSVISVEEWTLFEEFVEEEANKIDDSEDEVVRLEDLWTYVGGGAKTAGTLSEEVQCTDDCEQCDIPEEYKYSSMDAADVMAFLGIRRAEPIHNKQQLRLNENVDEETGDWR